MKLDLDNKEAVVMRFLIQRELECFEHDESVPKPDLKFISAQENYHNILMQLAKKLKND